MCKLHDLGYGVVKEVLHGDTLSVDGSQVGILEQGHEVCLSGLLKSHDGGRLEAQVGLLSRVSGHETRG